MSGFMSVKTEDFDLDTQDEGPDKDTQTQDPNNQIDNETGTSGTDTWKKRYGDQQRYVTQLQQEKATLEQEILSLKKTPIILPKTKEELDIFKKEYPDLVDSIITITRMELAGRDEELNKKFQEVDGRIQDLTAAEKIETVLKVHPDAKKIKASQEFAEWFEKQSKGTMELFKSDDPSDWVRGISIYKSETGIKTTKSKKADAAMSTDSTPSAGEVGLGKRTYKASEVQKMTEAQYARHRDDIFKAMTEGRYIKDID